MAAQGRGAGLAGPATAENKSKGSVRNSAPLWAVIQRAHAARAVALLGAGRNPSRTFAKCRGRA